MQARIDLHTFFIFPSVHLGSCFYYKCVNQQLMNEGEYHMKNIWYARGGGGNSAYERDGMLVGIFELNP